ncbi:MAG TPA: HAMP domain-containing sensor histidine kinase [Ktedonobacterales bacterium]|nr:HAMP domain-containing sensor histidine kinase [Ktedonobacterales bacterium]
MIDALVEGELEQLKTRLFSAMAHELRTPLASLRLAAGLLVSAPPAGATEEHRQLFQFILQSSDRLDLLINSLLDYARLEANHLQLNAQMVDLRLILDSVAGLLAPHYRAKRQTLDVSLPEQPVNVYADPFRLKSAVQALLETACKRCPADGSLRMGCRGQESDAVGWVCDTGPAVPAEAREQIFTHAYWQTQEDPPSLTAFGLGLPLASGLLTLHGGSLWLDEPEAQKAGVCFHFRLPLAHP